MTPGVAYCAGPMTGIPGFNFPAFDSLTSYMRSHGWVVVNPAERDREMYDTTGPGFAEGDQKLWSESTGFDFHEAMRYDLGAITECDAIVFLPGWESSTGCAHEKYVAEVCGLELLYAYPVRSEWFVSNVCMDSQVNA